MGKYSSYQKLLRITAYILRLIYNCRTRQESRRPGSCNTEEIQKSALLWIKCCQEQTYPEEYCALTRKQKPNRSLPRIRQLQLYLDENNVIKCKGRMQNAPIPETAKYPMLLPANEPLTTLLVKEAHQQLLHSGFNSTIAHIRQSIWIPSIRQFVQENNTEMCNLP